MARSLRRPVFLLVAITLMAATAFAAWNLTTNEYNGYTGAIGTLRTNLATWTTGANSSTIGKATITLLKRADKHFAKAVARITTPTTSKMVKKSLYSLEDGAYYLLQAARLEKRNTTFRTFVTNSCTSATNEAKKLAVSASNYVMTNHTSKKATRKLLRAGGKTTKAASKAKAGKYNKAIALYNKAIQLLAKAKLL